MQSVIHASQRIVVKVGSSLVTNDGKGLDHAALSRWASEIADLTRRGKQVVLVSSGAIAEGAATAGLGDPTQGGARIANRRRRRPDGAGAGV